MQENTVDQPPSLSQMLRESYLAEARAQQRHTEMSRSDASSSRLQIYGSLKGKPEDSRAHGENQFTDLSAFLSQEELDKSVNLARQAIGHEPREVDVKTCVTPVSYSAALVSPSSPSSVTFTDPATPAAPATATFPQPAPEELSAAHTTSTPNRKMHGSFSARQDNVMRNSREPGEGVNDRSTRSAPYGLETQSKKEFLNKAADFIEELSSLFKANSSKRVRPRSCKAHRTKIKSQSDETVYPSSPDNRERSIVHVEEEKDRVSPVLSHQPLIQLDAGAGYQESHDRSSTEELHDSQEMEEAERTEAPSYSTEPVCEPPTFIQKLKSREVPEGSKVQLDCIVRGMPVPEVRWFCEGKELENSPDIQILTNGELHSLIIAEAFEEDTGRYSCFASNFYGTDSTSAEIYIEGASSSDSEADHHVEHVAHSPLKSIPTSTETTDTCRPTQLDTSPEEEPSVHISDTVSEFHPPLQTTVASQKQDIQGRLAPPEGAESDTSDFPLQSIASASPGETKVIETPESCTPPSVTSAPESTSSTQNSVVSLQLIPTSQPENQSLNSMFMPGLNGQSVMAAPVFTKSLQDIHASEGQLVVLECRVKGAPSPRVDWYQEGRIITDSPDFRILQKKPRSPAEPEEICTLVIAEVFPEDSGLFTCTASNKYGTVSSTATLNVKGNGNHDQHARLVGSLTVEPSPLQQLPPSYVPVQREATNSIKPHSSTIRLDPLLTSTIRLDPLNTSSLRLDPQSSSVLRPDPQYPNLPVLEPTSGSNFNHPITPTLDPSSHNQDPADAYTGAQNRVQMFSYPKPYVAPSVDEQSSPERSSRDKGMTDQQNGSIVVIPLPDPPANSCLKSGTLTNHRDSRSSKRRVHFKLPEDEEDEQSDASGQSEEDNSDGLSSKEPPPVLAKPKLDPAQLQLLHNQVLLEQQQETEPPTQTHTQVHAQPSFLNKPEVQASHATPPWSQSVHQDPPQPKTLPSKVNVTTTPQPAPASAPPPITRPPAQTSSGGLNTTYSPVFCTSPAPHFSSPPSIPQFQTSTLITSPPPVPQLSTAPPSTASVTQFNTIHASHLNISSSVLSQTAPIPQFFTPTMPKLSVVPTESTAASQQVTSPAALLRSTHASLMNLTATSHSFNYTRPKEFIAAQTFSPVRSPSPTESPVPLLQELAAELNSSAASSPTLPPFSPPPRFFPTRVLKSPTSPPSLVSSPTPGSMPLMNSVFALRAQSPPQASSPTSSSSTPSPIQNPVAFLSSVLPSLTPTHQTNSMGLPKGAPVGVHKKAPKLRPQSTQELRESRELLLHDIEKKLQFKDNYFPYQQKLSNEGKTASRHLGPNIPATVFNYDEEYKVSNFEQRLMSEIEFRLERTPVEESDDEVQHDDIPRGKCIAPIFDKKLKNFKASEGVPVTLSCKIVGIPVPKVYWFKDGKQILRKNLHYKKVREGDGTCALHIASTNSDDDGNYTVMAANPQGRISCSGHLIIQTGPPRHRLTPIHSQRVRTRIQEVEVEQTQERSFRPHFLQAPGDMLGHEGGLCRLDCKVSGLPSPELMWLVNGRPIYPDQYHKMLVRENGMHSLVIDPVTQKDAGTYTCIASNKAGQSSFSLDLTVVEKETKHPPRFVEKLQNMGIPEGTPVRLECRVQGMPPPVIFWKKDNETVPKTKNRMSMQQDTTGYVCLLIQPTTKDDAGWYTVSAKNEAGVVSSTCRLDIYAQWHQSIPTPMKKVQRPGSRYAALTGQGLDIKSSFPTSDTNPILFSSSPPEATLESEEL
ncbi:myopalladin [Synchiropus splendidus]|uniref:myopalladin n=1 Tax=Synchiropus splendidus TaxID=270530 RepID=UPI00237DDEA4|nr:myopalladin [Synchiropus splendidus]